MRRMLRHLIVAAVVLSVLPASSQAAELIGSDLSGTPLGTSCNHVDGCLVIQEKIGGVFVEPSARGVITQWWTRGAVDEISLEVFRHRSGVAFTPGVLNATYVDSSETRVGAGAGVTQMFPTRVPVRAGDYIGLFVADGGAYGHKHMPPPDTNAFKPDPTAEDVYAPAGFEIELYLRAKVEPDADRDGLGDETQDPCVCFPSSPAPVRPAAPDPFASIRAKGPRVSIGSSARASRKGRVPVTISNPYGFALKGKLTLKLKGKKIGSKSYSLPANGKKKVDVKLKRSAFRTLKRRKRLRVSAAAKSRAAVGRARTTKRKITIKAPKKKKRKRKRRPSGDSTAFSGSLYACCDFDDVDSGGKVRLKVKGNTVYDFAYSDTLYHCLGSGFTPTDDTFEPASGGFKSATIQSDGSFTSTTQAGDMKQVVEGTVRGNVAEGKIVAYGFGSCSKNWMFRARAG